MRSYKLKLGAQKVVRRKITMNTAHKRARAASKSNASQKKQRLDEPNNTSRIIVLESLPAGKLCIPRPSGDTGKGLFLGENVKEDDFLGQYVGEICSKVLTERRALVREQSQNPNYAIILPDGGSIDADRTGNIFRFIKHSKTPNCYHKFVTVQGNIHIAIYANKGLKSKTELTLDYENDGKPESQNNVARRSKKRASQPGTSSSK